MAALAVLTAGCKRSLEPEGNDHFPLQVGQTKDLTEFRLSFEEVSSDSRCPTDVVCASAGNAAVVIRAQMPGTKNLPPPQTINTNDEPRFLNIAGVRLEIDSVKPAPLSGVVIPQNNYIVFFGVYRGLQ